MSDELLPPKVGDFVIAHWRKDLSYDYASNGNEVMAVNEKGIWTKSTFHGGIQFFSFERYRFWLDPYYRRFDFVNRYNSGYYISRGHREPYPECPYCCAEAGQPCVVIWGKTKGKLADVTHQGRQDLVNPYSESFRGHAKS